MSDEDVDWDQTLSNTSSEYCPPVDGQSRLYFHQLPLLSSGEAPNPWGYWSLQPDFVPGPWPLLDIPGVELTCRYVETCYSCETNSLNDNHRVRSHYARVSTFEAEMLVYLNKLRRSRELSESHARPPMAARIVELPF